MVTFRSLRTSTFPKTRNTFGLFHGFVNVDLSTAKNPALPNDRKSVDERESCHDHITKYYVKISANHSGGAALGSTVLDRSTLESWVKIRSDNVCTVQTGYLGSQRTDEQGGGSERKVSVRVW
jgi:hypothetical protein